MSKPIIKDEDWVYLYAQLSYYVEKKCYPDRITHDASGDRTEESDEDFCEICSDIEDIMRKVLTKESDQWIELEDNSIKHEVIT